MVEFKEAVPTDDIEPPERSDKLHPYEDEDDEDWEEFRKSVGTEPNKPLDVVDRGDHYEIIDGDRRFRALTENEADTVRCLVYQEDEEVADEHKKTIKMVSSNEFRKPSNKKKRAWHISQLVAPHLLKPGERKDTEQMTQKEVSEEVGKAQPTISSWLNPMREKEKLRATLGQMASGHRPDDNEVEQIDNIVDLLKRGGDTDNLVISIGQEAFVATQLDDFEGVSLGELENAAQKAVDENWDSSRFLEYVNENFAYDDLGQDIEAETGMLDGSDTSFEDTDFEDDSVSVDDVDVDEEEEFDFGVPEIDVDWSNHVDDSDLPKDTSLSGIETHNKFLTAKFEDDAAIGLKILEHKTGMTQTEVIENLVEPLVVDQVVRVLGDEE